MRTLCVVTGGAGFIGSHLARALVAAGRPVRIVDDFSTGRRSLVPAGVELLEGDVNAVADAAVRDADAVFHLAGLPSVPRSVRRPLQSHAATATGTLSILTAAERAGVRRVLLASSSSVYGDTDLLPKREDQVPRPASPYAAAMLGAELYGRAWAAVARVETVALRFFNVYGPDQDPSSAYAAVIPLFIRRILAGEAMTVNGDGGQTRDFTYVGDVVQGLLAAAAAPGLSGKIYNLAGGRPVSVLEMGRLLAGLVGKPARFDFLPPRPGDIRDSFADPSAARRDFGFAAPTSLPEGLRRTLASFPGNGP